MASLKALRRKVVAAETQEAPHGQRSIASLIS
jgi:hypothetical protein